MITMSWSDITRNGKTYVNEVLDSGWLSRKTYIPRFEEAVADKHGAKHGILVSSGTDALRISLATLKELDRWPLHSEVIVPAVTFVATVNAVLQNGLKPIFGDVDRTTCNLVNPAIGSRTVAIIPVHLFGLPANISVDTKSVRVIEDSCETFGVHQLQGDMSCFSFYMSHHVGTGVGGMILTNSDKYDKIARSYQNHGRIDDGTHFRFGRSGFSSRITELEAALGVAGLEHFDQDLQQRRTLARHYIWGLTQIAELQLTMYADQHSWMFYPVKLQEGNRKKLMVHLRKNGIESREAMPVINQPVFRDLYKKGSCPNAEDWTRNGLLLPLHPQMSEKDVNYVCEKVDQFFK